MVAWINRMFQSAPEFFRKALLSFSMRFGGLFIQFFGSIVVARLLGAEGFGAFTYATTWAIFIGMMLPLGMGELSVRELPGYLARGEREKITGFLVSTLVTILITGGLATAGLALLERFDILVLGPGWKLVALVAVTHALVLSVSHALNGFHRILTSQFLETILRQIIYLSLIGLAVAAGVMLHPDRVFEISLLAALPTLAVMVHVLTKAWYAQAGGPVSPDFRLRLWFAGALPLFLTAFANRLQLDLDVLMVGAMLGDFEVGLYRAAARGAILVSIANMIALQLVAPMLSRALAREERDETQKLLSQAALVSFATGIPIVLIFGFGASIYLGLYGPDFTAASTSLRLLLIGQTTIVLAGADAILLIMLHRERLVFVVTFIGVLMNFGLNLALIGPMGMNGAAVASLASMAFVRISLVAVVLRTTGFDTTVFSWLTRRGRG